MGRETRNFRQTKRASSADSSNKSYARINRQGSFRKFVNVFKGGGKV